MTVSDRGVLYPARLPEFHRLAADQSVKDLVRWFWIPEWDLAPGESSRQLLVAFPALNLVVEGETVLLTGVTTRCSHRDLSGRGWAVGALLRPAAVPLFTEQPALLRDGQLDLDFPGLQREVAAAMGRSEELAPEQRRAQAVQIFADWLATAAGELSAEALLANAMAELIEEDPEIVRLEDLAERLALSKRSVQRLAEKYIGISPLAMIRRRRIQEAAYRVRTEPEVSLAEIASGYGYADHAHLTKDFQSILGFNPSEYRRG